MSLFEHYAPRGLECVCGNLRMAARAVSSIYDRHLKAVGLQSSQMAVLWAVAGRRSAPINEIAGVIAMDETTLLRNLRVLERRRLVAFHVGDDRRERIAAERVDAFVDALKVHRIGYSWAGPVSLAVPFDIRALRRDAGWRGALVRFSVGLEAVDDLIADAEQALARLRA